MQCDCCSGKLNRKNLNDILRKESRSKKYFFNLRGWVTNMVAHIDNMEGSQRSVGPRALERFKTFECYFLRLSEPQGSKEQEGTRFYKQL